MNTDLVILIILLIILIVGGGVLFTYFEKKEQELEDKIAEEIANRIQSEKKLQDILPKGTALAHCKTSTPTKPIDQPEEKDYLWTIVEGQNSTKGLTGDNLIDYGEINSAEVCQQACDEDKKCGAFTFYKEDSSENANKCFGRSIAPRTWKRETTPGINVISGFKRRDIDADYSWDIANNYDAIYSVSD